MSADGPPLVVSSNRYNDIHPVATRIYKSDRKCWGSKLPWEFPQNAGKEEEEAFLRAQFPDTEILHLGLAEEAFRFLKQVWYSIALWNLEVRIPEIANQWLCENEHVWQDRGMVEFLCSEAVELSAFAFSSKQVEEYGNKLLRWAVVNIQWYTRGWHGLQQPADDKAQDTKEVTKAEEKASVAQDSLKDSDTSSKKLPPSKSAEPAKAEPASTELPVKELSKTPTFSVPHTAPAHVDRFSTLARMPAQPYGMPVQPGRQRGNSNGRRGSYRGGGRGPNQQQPFHYVPMPSQQAPARYSTTSPRLGSMQIHQIQNQQIQNQQMRSHSGPPPHAEFMTAEQARMMNLQHIQQIQHMQRMQGPPPPGFDGQMMQQQSYGSAPIPQQPPPPLPPGMQMFTPLHGMPQDNQYYNSPAMFDRSNNRYDNRTFSGASSTDANSVSHDQASRRGMPRRESMSSRGGGGNKSRGGYKSGRSNASRGSSSFGSEARAGKEMPSGHGHFTNELNPVRRGHGYGQSDQPFFPPGESYPKSRNRHNGMASGDWRRQSDRLPSQVQQTGENMSSDRRAFSGTGPPPVNMFPGPDLRTAGFHPGYPTPPVDQETWHKKQFEDNRSVSRPQKPPHGFTNSHARSHENRSKTARYHSISDLTEEERVALQPVQGVIHDEREAAAARSKEKVLTKNYIGMECTHVQKLAIFGVSLSVRESEIQAKFSFAAEDAQSVHVSRGRTNEVVYVTFGSHQMMRQALELVSSGQIMFDNSWIRVEVPREYWDRENRLYPGYGVPSTPTRNGDRRRSEAPASAPASAQQAAAVAPTPYSGVQAAAPTQASNYTRQHATGSSSIGSRKPSLAVTPVRQDVLSEETTPTASGATTPKGRKQKKSKRGKGKKQSVDEDVKADATQPALLKHEHETIVANDQPNEQVDDGRSDTSTATVIRDPAVVAAKLPDAPEVRFDPEGGASGVSNDLQKDSGSALDQEKEEDSSRPKVKVVVPDHSQPIERATDENDASFRQSFRTTQSKEETEGKKNHEVSVEVAGGDDVHAPGVTQEVVDASPQKSEEDHADDSFHTASGSPHGSEQGCSEENRAAESTDVAKAVGESGGVEKAAPSKRKEDLAPSKDIENETMKSPSPAVDQAKIPRKAPVPQVPKVKIAEPASSGGKPGDDKGESSTGQRSTSGLSVPPTPAFQTAPTTPALPSAGDNEEGAPTETSENTKQPQQSKKAQKPKGPEQTVSLNPFAKQRTASKQSKKSTKKNKKRSGLDMRSSSMATSGTFSGVASGATTPNADTVYKPVVSFEKTEDEKVEATQTAPEGDNDEAGTAVDETEDRGDKTDSNNMEPVERDQDADEMGRVASPRSGSRSSSKRRGVVDYLQSFLPGSKQPSQTSTLEITPAELATEDDQEMSMDEAAIKTPATGDEEPCNEEPAEISNVTDDSPADGHMPAPTAQMLPHDDKTSSTSDIMQPFLEAPRFLDNDGPRDSGHSGGQSQPSEVGLGISDAVLDASPMAAESSKPKKKKKKASGQRKRSRAATQSGAGLVEETEGGITE